MRVIEIGGYVSLGFAGMLLAEQGHEVVKLVNPRAEDPILSLRHGAELWDWVNHGKKLVPTDLATFGADELWLYVDSAQVVIDNIRMASWDAWGLGDVVRDPPVPWVHLADDFDGHSFDAIAQARAWGDHVGYVPAYIGDTAAGLWMAFKALSLVNQGQKGLHVLGQATCLAKLVEGELVVPVERDGRRTPWDEPGTYWGDDNGGHVAYRGQMYEEPNRDDAWRRANLDVDETGRYRI